MTRRVLFLLAVSTAHSLAWARGGGGGDPTFLLYLFGVVLAFLSCYAIGRLLGETSTDGAILAGFIAFLLGTMVLLLVVGK